MAPVTAWRITSARYADVAFNGEGAKQYGGRFNSVGVPVVYTSGSLSLATLELLARVSQRRRLADRVCVPVTFDESDVLTYAASDLPDGWDARPYGAASQQIGDEWIRSETSLVLRVPSVVVPREFNYLINPRHPDVDRLAIGDAEPLNPDPRITRE